jgi:predicted DNA-binding transcriptional regulator YafY
MSKEQRSHGRTTVRLRSLDRMIREGRCRSAGQAANELSDEFGKLSARTVARDIALLRDQHRAPIEYDARQRRYIYTNKSFALPAMQMTEGELVAIFLAERLMHQYRGAPFEQHLRTAFQKIVDYLPEQVSVDFSSFDQHYSFEIGPTSEIAAEVFDAINRAASERLTVEIRYYSQSRDEETVRSIDPYLLHNHRGEWYVVAYDHWRKTERDFHLGRIRWFRVTEDHFPPPQFDREAYLKSGFEMFRGGEEHLVEIEFDAYQARWIRERKEWHDNEEREDLPDGGLLLRMKLAGLEAVKRFVMQYGAHAKVRGPAILQEMIEQELLQMLRNYGITPPSTGSDQPPKPEERQL